jgi:hypothetical protein
MKVISAKPLSNFRLRLKFADGAEGIADLSSIAGKGVFQAWLEPGFFNQAFITGTGSIAWPGDLDLCPDALYLEMTGKQPEDLFPKLKPDAVRA